MYHTEIWASDCSYVDAADTDNLIWVYCFFKENKASIEAMRKGAAQPHVYAKDVNEMKLLSPDKVLMKRFRTVAEPLFRKIGKLKVENNHLAEARDRLLPRLMNREIEA